MLPRLEEVLSRNVQTIFTTQNKEGQQAPMGFALLR